MRIKRSAAAATAGLLCGLLVACAGHDSHYPGPEPMPSGDPTAEQFVDFSDLLLPDDLGNLEIARSHNESGGLRYEVSFTTSRTGAEMFCDRPENFGIYESTQGPDEEDREEFRIPANAESVDGKTEYRGGHPGEADIKRTAPILCPDEEQADVYVQVDRFNTR